MSIQTCEFPCRSGKLGVLTLDSPATLNALTSEMFGQIQRQLDAWAADDSLSLVLINASGDRGFSTGADIREIYHALDRPDAADAVADIIARGYRTNYTIQTFPRPVVTVAQGIAVGGGVGLLQASRYRLVTPTTTLAMPEVDIGLFPGAGASWFLNRLPGSIGMFMGLTGARLNAPDAMRIGMADLAIEHGQQDELIQRITDQHWTGEVAADDNRLFRLLNQLPEAPADALPDSNLAVHEQNIARCCRRDELPRVVQRLLNSTIADDWWQGCVSRLARACPVSLLLLEHQLANGLQMSLQDILRMELTMASNCARHPDLREGIRARIIDRDNQPGWSHNGLAEVSEEFVESHFVAHWSEAEHPLADL